MKFKTLACSFVACFLAAGSAQAAITISTNNSGGSGRVINSSAGVAVASGSGTLHVGYFLDPNAAVLKSGNLAAILPLFIPLGENRPGLGSTGGNFAIGSVTAGRWNTQIPSVTGTNDATAGPPSATSLVQGTRLFILAYNTAQNEYALFGDSALWVAPKDDPNIPGGASLSMAANITNLDAASASTEVYWGSYPATGNFINMAPIANIPEPGAASVGLLATLGLLIRRRR